MSCDCILETVGVSAVPAVRGRLRFVGLPCSSEELPESCGVHVACVCVKMPLVTSMLNLPHIPVYTGAQYS